MPVRGCLTFRGTQRGTVPVSSFEQISTAGCRCGIPETMSDGTHGVGNDSELVIRRGFLVLAKRVLEPLAKIRNQAVEDKDIENFIAVLSRLILAVTIET